MIAQATWDFVLRGTAQADDRQVASTSMKLNKKVEAITWLASDQCLCAAQRDFLGQRCRGSTRGLRLAGRWPK